MKPTNEKQVFEVMEVKHISENTWKVRGRNYKDISVGDILYIHVEDKQITLPFEVLEIIAFGRKLTEISYGYASELVVQGEGGRNLSQINHLYAL
jgi:hypothetical protein